MKKVFYFVLLSLVLVACSQSPEQKAETLIKENMKKSLYKPDTYEPVETKVDSAFAPYDDPVFYKALDELGVVNSEMEECDMKVKQAKALMAINSGSHHSAYSRNEYAEAKKEYEEANAQLERLDKTFQKRYDKALELFLKDRTFVGYKAFHCYRADNNAGQRIIDDIVFFIDENFKEVKFSMRLEEYREVQKNLKLWKENIEATEEE